MLSSSPKSGAGHMAANAPVEATAPAARYNSTDEMRAEFGDYRVNTNTDKLCDTSSKGEYGSNNMDGLYLTNQ